MVNFKLEKITGIFFPPGIIKHETEDKVTYEISHQKEEWV